MYRCLVPRKKGEKSSKRCVYEKQKQNKANTRGQAYQQQWAENILLWGVGERLWVCRRGDLSGSQRERGQVASGGQKPGFLETGAGREPHKLQPLCSHSQLPGHKCSRGSFERRSPPLLDSTWSVVKHFLCSRSVYAPTESGCPGITWVVSS